MKKETITQMARDRMKEAVDWDRDNRLEAKIDLEHLAGMQWPDDIKADRENAGRPCLTINRLPQFVRQVTGDLRRLNPAIKIIPGDDAASEEEAELIGGIVRGIEYTSQAEKIYEGTAELAAQCGIGQFRILTDYEHDDSFNQVIRIERIHNPFAVYWDPKSRESTREDADYCFVTQEMSEDDFKDAYPDKALADVEVEKNTDGRENWRIGQKVIVAEYFWKEPVEKKIGLTETGEVIELGEGWAAHNFVKTRTVQTHKVMWAKISADDVLEGPKEFPSKYIPVIAVTGEEITVGEQIIRTSVHRFARDPQRMYNYWRSASTEMVALQPKAPYLVTGTHIKGQEAAWTAANDSNAPYLVYTPDAKAPPPARMTPPVPASGMFQEISLAADDMKAVTGIYDAALGARSSETSGVAIRQRQMESDISTSIYSDNLAKAIAHAGRIIVDMIPRVYDTNRIVPTVTNDEKEGVTEINAVIAQTPEGVEYLNKITGGRFNVRVSVGPNYATRRQEAAEGMLQFIQAVPGAGQVAGDLIAKSMEWPDADKLAKRLEKTLPPNLREPESLDEVEQQQVAAANQQQQAQMQMMQQAVALDMQKKQAETAKTVAQAESEQADAEKTKAEAMQTQIEVAMKTGQINQVIEQIVQAEVARAITWIAGQRG